MTDTDTTTPSTTDLQNVVDRYFELWNERDPQRRADLAASVFTDDGRHVDPLADVRGATELSAMIGGVHERFADHRLVRTSGLDAHHDTVRYGWRLEGPDGTVVVTALDVALLAPDGRYASVVAFFSDLPAVA